MTNKDIRGEVFVLRYRIKKHMEQVFTNQNDIILDVGCGDDPFYKKSIQGKIIGFDIRPSKYTLVVGDAHHLPFSDMVFDKVIVANSLYYFKNPNRVIDEISRVLKKGGVVFISVPFHYPVHDKPHDRYRFTEFGLTSLLEDKFTIWYTSSIGGVFAIPSIILHAILKGAPLIAPPPFKKLAKITANLIFYIPYISAQIFSILDIFDTSNRWSTYYVTVAKKNGLHKK